MIGRCLYESDSCFKKYGKKGITVCDEWLDFPRFLQDMGERPEGLTLDRKNNDLGYCRDNCRWADVKTQARNKRNNKIFTIQGIEACMAEHCERIGIKQGRVFNRLALGWSPEDAFLTPIRKLVRRARLIPASIRD